MVLQHSSIINSRQKMGDTTVAQLTPRQIDSGHQPDWAGLVRNLGKSLSAEFLSAIEIVLSFSSLSSLEFRSYSRKITALIELAHRTLVNSGVPVYEFSYCAPSLVPHKVAYIRLLQLLKDRRDDVELSLQDRVRHLLVPLSPSFLIHRRGEAGSPQGIMHNPKALNVLTHLDTWDCSAPSSSHAIPCRASMPPPPPGMPASTKRVISSLDNGGTPKRLWTTDESLRLLTSLKGVRKGETGIRRSKRRRSSSTKKKADRISEPNADQENAAPTVSSAEGPGAIPYCIIHPLPRRFGIFCTGKTSMHGPDPRAWRSRTIAVRPIE